MLNTKIILNEKVKSRLFAGKKILILFIIVWASVNNTKAQDVWKMNPMQVSKISLGALGSYLKYSCYDSILQVTVVDSSSVYAYYLQYNSYNGLLAFYSPTLDYLHMVVYNINNHAFAHDSIYEPNFCNGPPQIHGNSALFYSCDLWNTVEKEILIYFDIISSSLLASSFYYTNQWWFSATFSNGWFMDFEKGSTVLQIPDQRNFMCTQKGMYGSNGGITGDNAFLLPIDGILESVNYDTPFAGYYSNDSCGDFFSYSAQVYETKNGIAYIYDSIAMRLAADDPWLNQWKILTFPQLYNGMHSEVILKDRVFAFAVNKDTVATVYSAAYNFNTHAWVADSVQSNRVSNLLITNGTITWSDSTGTNFTRGYSDSLGWGNFNTPLDIDFYVENYQSPANGNLVYVRNMTIGSDNTLIDWGDGITTTLKSQSHLYKNPNGTYRTSSTTFSYDICIYALGQSNCKTVTFTNTTGITNAIIDNKLITLRYALEPGKFIIDNNTHLPLQIIITNMLGQKIETFSCDRAHQSFSLQHQPQGVYILTATIEGEKMQQSLKLVNGR